MKLTILHNPKCSKSREAIQLLKDHDLPFVEHLYLVNAVEEKTLSFLWDHLEKPQEMVRTKEDLYKNAPFEIDNKEKVIQKLQKHPELLERPILFTEKAAVVGRPTEKVKDFIKKLFI
ncbi:MAG: arsenate reductase family protein [Oligoflexia bacterium]|nr:arsenate reductase family protein [Oligoflexia bacterium]